MTDQTQDPQDDEPPEDEGPDAAELDQDPAYSPDDDELKDLKGG